MITKNGNRRASGTWKILLNNMHHVHKRTGPPAVAAYSLLPSQEGLHKKRTV